MAIRDPCGNKVFYDPEFDVLVAIKHSVVDRIRQSKTGRSGGDVVVEFTSDGAPLCTVACKNATVITVSEVGVAVHAIARPKIAGESFSPVTGLKDGQFFVSNIESLIDWDDSQAFFESWKTGCVQ